MDIVISNAVSQPIYEQIFSQIKNAIISGQVPEGEALPSIRTLAKDLRISVITTKRAYDELERAGYIHTVAGKGSFVAETNSQVIREEHLQRIEGLMLKILELAPACGLSDGDIIEMLETLQKEAR